MPKKYMKIFSRQNILLTLGVLVLASFIPILFWLGGNWLSHIKKDKAIQNSTIIVEKDKGSTILHSRDDIDDYLINRYINHLTKENDTVELKMVNDVKNSRYNMP